MVALEQLPPPASPTPAAFAVEPTMSVNITVASTRSDAGTPVDCIPDVAEEALDLVDDRRNIGDGP